MSLNRMFVFIVVFFVFSASLLSFFPPEFRILGMQAEYQDKEVADYFDEHNVLQYNYSFSLNLTYPDIQTKDYGLPGNEKLEFQWVYGDYMLYQEDVIELRHTDSGFMGWWTVWHRLEVQEPYASQVQFPGWGLLKEDVVALWDEEYNASYSEWSCDHMDVKLFIFSANQSWTIEESWDNGELVFFTSYGVDWEKTGYSMWGVMGQLMAFQNPDLGIPGQGGSILSAGVGAALWAGVALLFFALITSVIPFIRGWGGD